MELKLQNLKQKNNLENEKQNLIEVMNYFIDSVDFEEKYEFGRPKTSISDIVKSLLMMSYHGFSYRRAESDLREMRNKGIIKFLPKRATLNKYMQDREFLERIEGLIQLSALMFVDYEDTLIIDSSWLAMRMYTGGYRKVYDKKSTPLQKCRKIHIACLKNSKIIACAKTSLGTEHDSPFFKEMLVKVLRIGFNIKNLLADAGYCSKDNYAFCDAYNINNVFIDFKAKSGFRHPKSKTWRNQLKLFQNNRELWHEKYRFRVLVEGIFSAIKRKHVNYLRARNKIAQFNELLLKCLVYNLEVIGRYSKMNELGIKGEFVVEEKVG